MNLSRHPSLGRPAIGAIVLAFLILPSIVRAADAPVQRPPGSPQLKVIADHGGKPARPYYVAISGAGVDEDDGYSARIGPVAPAQPHTFSEQDMLPVKSDRLTPGDVQHRPLDLPGGFTPVFIVGDDDLSRQWLSVRGDTLRKINAIGLVVNVADEQRLNALRQQARGLELQPVQDDDLAARLGIEHYPVLISSNGLEQ